MRVFEKLTSFVRQYLEHKWPTTVRYELGDEHQNTSFAGAGDGGKENKGKGRGAGDNKKCRRVPKGLLNSLCFLSWSVHKIYHL